MGSGARAQVGGVGPGTALKVASAAIAGALSATSAAITGAITAASVALTGAFDTSAAAAVSTPAVVSGTAFTPSATTDAMVYYQLTAAAAGSYTVTYGPTTGAENTLANAAAVVIGESVVGAVYVPKGWKVVITVTTITIAQVKVTTL